jgi:hypothetical protein
MRFSNVSLHLQSDQKMLPYFIASNDRIVAATDLRVVRCMNF